MLGNLYFSSVNSLSQLRKLGTFSKRFIWKSLVSTYTALYTYIGEDKVNKMHLMVRQADREVDAGPQDPHSPPTCAGSPAEHTHSWKAELCPVASPTLFSKSNNFFEP